MHILIFIMNTTVLLFSKNILLKYANTSGKAQMPTFEIEDSTLKIIKKNLNNNPNKYVKQILFRNVLC